ncbi:hypothetical protein HYPSUDRAFT_35919 [Hypholoma sublateritium FD-334 SS-4]|uniref:Enoyl reductase (ER) domain-containing protein n=1 Tax=Hypholoma sublateritium (strain FD-334 SS-4) TaxID=945553 RepID=A0A0D2LGL7_HYPSF|nr:hypothetical protein HYPSUDRAFT_35919 [Hypholoma sublateritium FD-334 SS-4]
MSVHTAIAATAKGQIDVIQVPTRAPDAGEVLLRVEYAAMIAFDTYVTDLGFFVEEYPMILGFSASGTVSNLGSGVEGLKVGDRVTAFTFGESQNKGLQEYITLSKNVVAKIPDSLPLAAAATLPDNFVTSFYTLFNQLGLPIPASFPATIPPPLASVPVVIYGAGSVSGIYAVQLLHTAGYKKIVAIASERNHKYLHSIGATDTIDYRSPSFVEDISAAVGGDGKVLLAVDCIAAETTSLKTLGSVMSPLGKLAVLLPLKEGSTVTNAPDQELYGEVRPEKTPFPEGTELVYVRTFLYQQDETLREKLMPNILPALLESGGISPTRVRLLDLGSLLDRVSTGLQLLRENKISSEKVIVKVIA